MSDRTPISLMERQNMGLSPEDLEAVEIEALPNGMQQDVLPEGIEIIEEEDGAFQDCQRTARPISVKPFLKTGLGGRIQ